MQFRMLDEVERFVFPTIETSHFVLCGVRAMTVVAKTCIVAYSQGVFISTLKCMHIMHKAQ